MAARTPSEWSEVVWYVYVSPRGVRVLSRRPAPGELRAGELYVAEVRGVSRRAVVNKLREGVSPRELGRVILTAEENRIARQRQAADRQRAAEPWTATGAAA